MVHLLMGGPSVYPSLSPGKTVPAATKAAVAVFNAGTTITATANIKL
jgi:hypothetical protein